MHCAERGDRVAPWADIHRLLQPHTDRRRSGDGTNGEDEPRRMGRARRTGMAATCDLHQV